MWLFAHIHGSPVPCTVVPPPGWPGVLSDQPISYLGFQTSLLTCPMLAKLPPCSQPPASIPSLQSSLRGLGLCGSSNFHLPPSARRPIPRVTARSLPPPGTAPPKSSFEMFLSNHSSELLLLSLCASHKTCCQPGFPSSVNSSLFCPSVSLASPGLHFLAHSGACVLSL